MNRIIFLIIFTLTYSLASADDEISVIEFSGDVFATGSNVTHEGIGTDDLFMAGEKIQSSADITGSAHAAGRRVKLLGSIGKDVYAAGMDILLTKQVAGDVTVAGYEIVLGSSVGGDLRTSGSEVEINGAVTGYAMIAAESANLNSPISGDVSLAAENVHFGPDARIDGQLILYEENPGELIVPEHVITEDRISRRDIDDFKKRWKDDMSSVFSWRRAVFSFIAGVILVAAIAALIAGFAPEHLAKMRKKILNTPFRTLGFGFLTQAAVLGSAILFAMTIIGILFTPACVLLALILGFLGYVIGAYAFGVGLLLAFGRSEPETFRDRAMAAGTGALIAGLLAIIPFLGWLFVFALVLSGIGAIITHLFRPVFFAANS